MSRVIYIALVIQFYGVNTANILGLFSHTGKSHHMFFEPLLLKLAEKGHNMTVVSFFPVENPPPNCHDISFQGLAEIKISSYDLEIFEGNQIANKIPVLGRIIDQVSLSYQPFATSALHICEKLINFQPLLDALKGNYDLVLIESFMSDCMLGLLHVHGIRAPIVSISSTNPMPWASQRVGVFDNPSYVPSISTPFSCKMSFVDRLENTFLNFFVKKWHYIQIQSKEKDIIEKKFGKIPDLSELEKNISLILTNSYHTLNGVKPLVPGMVEVGGMHLGNKKQRIPQFIEKFLNESSDDVILFSLGSHIKTTSLPKYKEQMFVNALSKLKQRVIWKFEDSGEEGSLVGNILRVKWLPQYELLQHEKVVAFICHGGLLGMTEATAAGKPMIVMPFFGDQPTNAAAAAEAGVGIVLSYVDITEDSLSNALQTVISDKMREQARLVSNIWRDKETAPLERAVFWTEHVTRWGRSSRLHSAARDLSLAQLSLLDVAAVVFVTIILIITAIIYIMLKMIQIFKKATKEKLL